MSISREGAERTIETLNGILELMGRSRRLKVVRADNELSAAVIETPSEEVVRVFSLEEAVEVLAVVDRAIREGVSRLTD